MDDGKVKQQFSGNGRIDSFFIETRLHNCNAISCRFNMYSKMPSDRGKHCEFKKVEIQDDGRCSKFERMNENG